MFICPQCQFNNPETNKFCQRCGTSLTHKVCHECGANVPFEEENCPQCNAFTGTVLWAIVANEPIVEKNLDSQTEFTTSPEPSVSASSEESETDLLTEITEAEEEIAQEELLVSQETLEVTQTSSTVAQQSEQESDISSLPSITIDSEEEEEIVKLSPEHLNNDYLDAQKRYRWLIDAQDQQMQLQPTKQLLQIRVLDSQPLQPSRLEIVLEEQAEILEELEKYLAESQLSNTEFWHKIGIPAIALPYFTLQEFAPTIPEIRDTWKEKDRAVVLLEDRSQWQLISDLWGSEQLPNWQILYWLDEMAKLWQELSKVNCCQSLLEESNLRLDEYQNFCLQQLYLDPPEAKLTLQDLAQTWQLLFNKSGRTQYGSVAQLLDEMVEGVIKTVKELSFKLQTIIREQQQQSLPQPENISTQNNLLDNQEEIIPTVASEKDQEGMSYYNESDDMPTVVLPMELLSLDDTGCSDIGRQRDHNEDYFGIQTKTSKQENVLGKSMQARGLYIVCDGMGGHAGGEVASAMAVETLQKYFQEHWQEELPDEETINQGILLANETLYKVNLENARSGSGRMGTTLVIALVQDTKIAIAHVGDSRIYKISRKWGLEQLTVDHEVGQREIQRGVESEVAYARPDAYQLTQALGPRDNNFIKPDIQIIEINEDSLLFLCSDGLSDNELIENHWQTYLAPLISSKANLEQGLIKLINFANQYNGHDNITGVVVKVKVRPNLEQHPLL